MELPILRRREQLAPNDGAVGKQKSRRCFGGVCPQIPLKQKGEQGSPLVPIDYAGRILLLTVIIGLPLVRRTGAGNAIRFCDPSSAPLQHALLGNGS
jgi:hypothetical protein